MYEGLKNLEVPRRARRGSGGAPAPRRNRPLKDHPYRRAILGTLTAVAIAATALGGYTYWRVSSNLGKGVDEQLAGLVDSAPNEPQNILIIGSDSRSFIDKDEQRDSPELRGPGGQRADTIVLLHVSGGEKKRAVLVHFPRDLRVDIPGYGQNKINAAYAFGENRKRGGGANLLIKTIKNFTGLRINHYVEVNFASFRSIVDAVGGVKIYVNRKFDDSKAGLRIPRAGCYEMDGKTALAFVRSRQDPTADLGRIQRQQLFMRSLLNRVKSVGFLLDLGRVIDLSEALGNGLRYNKEAADLGLARSIAAKVSSFDQRRVDFRMVPSDPQYINGISYVIARPHEAAPFFEALAADRALPPYGKTAQSVPKRSEVSVTVLNGTSRTGFAAVQGERLRKKKFNVIEVGNARNTDVTTITYQAGAELKADLVAKHFKGAIKRRANGVQTADVVVTLGADRIVPSGSPTPKQTRRQSPQELCA